MFSQTISEHLLHNWVSRLSIFGTLSVKQSGKLPGCQKHKAYLLAQQHFSMAEAGYYDVVESSVNVNWTFALEDSYFRNLQRV